MPLPGSVWDRSPHFLHKGKGGEDVYTPDGRGCVTGRFLELRKDPVKTCGRRSRVS